MIDNLNVEYIACSAIWYDNGLRYPMMSSYGVQTGFVLCGHRHPVIVAVLPTNVYYQDKLGRKEQLNVEWTPDTKIKEVQGFMTSKGRFVGREEGRDIAIKSGQLTAEQIESPTVLFSEDIFPDQAFRAEM